MATKEVPRWRRALAAAIVRKSQTSVHELTQRLQGRVSARALEEFTEIAASESGGDGAMPDALDEQIPKEERARYGIFFTPRDLADSMVARVDRDAVGRGVDLACGDGALLCALGRRAPSLALVGVERDPLLAVAAAAAIERLSGRDGAHDFVHCGDGLADRPGVHPATVVVGNPPYVGEKGNAALFRGLREEHPHLREFFGPRIDLHYLFLHRSLQVLAAGGLFLQLTSEYWLAATGARKLRAHLGSGLEGLEFERLGPGRFDAAPGHHSLVFAGRRTAGSRDDPRAESWTPFATADPLEGLPLGEVAIDRQGFVSGADRVTRRTASDVDAEPGTPIFLYRRGELPAAAERFARPLLRRGDCVANRIYRETPGDEVVLWLAGERSDPEELEAIEEVLGRFRPILESRREARRGTMPWYRIWWPRADADYAKPKLVVPRRTAEPAMCLDLSGARVSSDCTFVLAAPELQPVASLIAIMLVANTQAAWTHLAQYGKSKGEIVEFYSEPLRRLPLAVERRGGALQPIDPGLRDRWRSAIDRLRQGCVSIDA